MPLYMIPTAKNAFIIIMIILNGRILLGQKGAQIIGKVVIAQFERQKAPPHTLLIYYSRKYEPCLSLNRSHVKFGVPQGAGFGHRLSI